MSVYIKIPEIYQKLKAAEATSTPIYISGMAGFGKTCAVNYYLRKRAHINLSGTSGTLNSFPDPDEIRAGVIVIDDISWITDEESINYIQHLLYRKDIWVILIGRSNLPKWLRLIDLDLSISKATERDLLFSEKEISELFQAYGITLNTETLHGILNCSGGYAVFLLMLLKRMQTGTEFGSGLINLAREDMFQYSDTAFYSKWSDELKEVLLSVCEYDSFTPAMIFALTQKENVSSILEYANSVGSFIRQKDDGSLYFNTFLHRFFKWKKSFVYTEQQYKENYLLAAKYYEENDEVVLACKYYEKSKQYNAIRNILNRNSSLHPGVGHYFELRKYYMELPPEEVKLSPLLMSGLSMLYSIMLITEESDYWLNEIKAYAKKEDITKSQRQEANSRIAYLNIALPHKGITNIINYIKDSAILAMNKEVNLPEFSITSNLPSVMNGGLDFCEWSKIDTQLELLLKAPIELILGKGGKGLVNISMAESGYEKGTMDDYEIITRINKGILMSEAGGQIEIGFAGTGILIKHYIIHGQFQLAENQLASFSKKAKNSNAKQLYQNMTVMSVWLSLLQGDTSKASEWLKNSPNEAEEFCVLRRYQYIQKVRMLIALEKYNEALALIERLDYYFTEYQRTMLWIENQLLKSIVYSRLKFAQWSSILKQAVDKAAEYHFVNVIAIEGAAIKPLLDESKNLFKDKNYEKQVTKAVASVARFYPDYLKSGSSDIELLTDKEKEIVKLMLTGASSDEICKSCSITYNSLKFHNKNIYKKLGVKSRQEAERKATNLGLF